VLTVLACAWLNWPTQLVFKTFLLICIKSSGFRFFIITSFFLFLMISVLWQWVQKIISSGEKNAKCNCYKSVYKSRSGKALFHWCNTLQSPSRPFFFSLSRGQPSSVLFIFVLNAGCGPLCVIYAHFIYVCWWMHLYCIYTYGYIYKALHFYSSSGRRKWFSPLC